MSLHETFTRRPPIRTGDDGLPYCGWCQGETLCNWHRAQVTSILNGLKTPNLLGRAEADLRYVIRRPSLCKEEDA